LDVLVMPRNSSCVSWLAPGISRSMTYVFMLVPLSGGVDGCSCDRTAATAPAHPLHCRNLPPHLPY